ncbi:MAG TPA: extracellular solute-binding protein, partial [Candidatus Methylomirabilis sp.]
MATGGRVRTGAFLLAAGMAAAGGMACPWPGAAAQTEAERVAQLVEAAKREGEVHYIDPVVTPKTQEALARAFRRKYGLPESFKVTATVRGTGEVVAAVQQEIKAGRYTVDVVRVPSPPLFQAMAKQGHLMAYLSPEWRHYERTAQRLRLDAHPPYFVVPSGYTFVPVWNRKAIAADIRSWYDMLNPAFRGRAIMGDIRKSSSQLDVYIGLRKALGDDFFPRYGALTNPVFMFRMEEKIGKLISGEYAITMFMTWGRVYQRVTQNPQLDLGIANPREGVVLIGEHIGILAGAPHPNAAKLFLDFWLSEEGMAEYVRGEAYIPFREGFQYPAEVRPFLPALPDVKVIPVDWADLTAKDR